MNDRQPIREAIPGCDLRAEILKPDPNRDEYLKEHYNGACGVDTTSGHFCMAEFYDSHPEYRRHSQLGICEHVRRLMRR
jgi:hypothetical protein